MNPPGRRTIAGSEITVISVPDGATGDALGRRLVAGGVASPVPAVVVVGGAEGLAAADAARCERLFAEVLIPVLTVTGATVIDGGTDAGITRLVGRARRHAGAIGQHVGVVADGTVAWPELPHANGAAPLEPNHTHVVVVPGVEWGDEVPWLSAVASAIAGKARSITLLANGGEIAYRDVQASLTAGRRVFVLSGTGRTADEIAHAAATDSPESKALNVARSPLVTVLPEDPGKLILAIGSALRD
jgi:voltage-gated potassium channel Kch